MSKPPVIEPMPEILILADRVQQIARELMNITAALDALVPKPPKKRKREASPLIDPRTAETFAKRSSRHAAR